MTRFFDALFDGSGCDGTKSDFISYVYVNSGILAASIGPTVVIMPLLMVFCRASQKCMLACIYEGRMLSFAHATVPVCVQSRNYCVLKRVVANQNENPVAEQLNDKGDKKAAAAGHDVKFSRRYRFWKDRWLCARIRSRERLFESTPSECQVQFLRLDVVQIRDFHMRTVPPHHRSYATTCSNPRLGLTRQPHCPISI
jgi:hypothetical protein